MESLFVKFANKYICFRSLFKVRQEWNRGQLFKGEKRLRSTALKNDDSISYQSDSILNQILNKPRLKSNTLKFDSRLLLSSFWLLNMKRLVILKQQRKKISITGEK